MSEPTATDRRRRAIDVLLAALLLGGFAAIAVRAAFLHPEWYDWVAYALPAANLVNRGTLALPQLGRQLGFDRFWLLNSPLMGAGPVPAFALSHVGRVPYLVPVALGGVFNAVVFGAIVRDALGLKSRAVAVFAGFAFLGHRLVMSELFNQRYSVWSFGVLALAFRPTRNARGAIPAWRWGCAGALPLIHPVLAPATVAWVVAALATRRGPSTSGAARDRSDLVGPVLFVAAIAAAAGWYGRPEPLRSQLLPHICFHAMGREDAPSLGFLLEAIIGRPYSLIEQAESLTIAGAALAAVAAALLLRERGSSIEIHLAAVLIAGVVALDLLRGFRYLMLFLFGLGPCLLYEARTGWPRRIALAGLIGFASLQLLISLRVDRTPPTWVDQRDAVAFVVERTRPGDRIVLGPPFVLASSRTTWPGGRAVVGVTPQPFYLADFDPAQFRDDLRRRATVYVGEREWFEFVTPVFHREEDRAPIFLDATIAEDRFANRTVIVARARMPALPGSGMTWAKCPMVDAR